MHDHLLPTTGLDEGEDAAAEQPGSTAGAQVAGLKGAEDEAASEQLLANGSQAGRGSGKATASAEELAAPQSSSMVSV